MTRAKNVRNLIHSNVVMVLSRKPALNVFMHDSVLVLRQQRGQANLCKIEVRMVYMVISHG